MKAKRYLLALGIGTLGLALLGSAKAADPVRGKALFFNTNGAPLSCSAAACHAGFPAVMAKGIAKATNPASILDAIAKDKGGMGFLAAYVNATDAADIAAYVANPAAGSGSPAISLSATSLTFASQTVGTTSAAQTVIVSNTGTASLTLSGLTVAGTAAADFTRGGTCAAGSNVAAGGSCSIQLTFKPAATGARTAALTITHNAGGYSTVNLSGTGAASPAVAGVAPSSLSFTQQVGTTSAVQTVTVSNAGGQSFTVNTLGISGANAAEFSISSTSTCAAGTVVAGGANCTLRLTFVPTANGARSATLTIAHSAAGGPAAVALSGTGTATPQPAISLSAPTLAFDTQSVGSSAANSLTVTNSGQAPLTLGALTLGGAAGGDFSLGGTCTSGVNVAPSATCSLQVSFAPTVVGTRNGTLTVASNASNGSQLVSLSGNGVQYSINVTPKSSSLQTMVGTTSAPLQAVIENDGGSALTVSSIAITGPFVVQPGSNSCGDAPLILVPGQICNVYIAFQPNGEGTANGEVAIVSEASSTPTLITLTAVGTAAPQTASTLTPTGQAPAPTGSPAGSPFNAGGGCTVGADDELFDPLIAGMLGMALVAVARRRMQGRRR